MNSTVCPQQMSRTKVEIKSLLKDFVKVEYYHEYFVMLTNIAFSLILRILINFTAKSGQPVKRFNNVSAKSNFIPILKCGMITLLS